MPLILPCSISWHEQACFYRSDQQWTDSQINNSKGLKQKIRKKSVLSSPKSSLQVKEAFGAVYFDFTSMSAVRPAREQILYLYLCSRHLPVVSYEKSLTSSTWERVLTLKTTVLTASCSCRPEKLRHACSFQVISTTTSLSVVLQSPDTEHTFMGTSWRILPAICTWFVIVLCFVILYVVKVQTDSYIQGPKACRFPQQYRSACLLPKAQLGSLCLLEQRGDFRESPYVRSEVWTVIFLILVSEAGAPAAPWLGCARSLRCCPSGCRRAQRCPRSPRPCPLCSPAPSHFRSRRSWRLREYIFSLQGLLRCTVGCLAPRMSYGIGNSPPCSSSSPRRAPARTDGPRGSRRRCRSCGTAWSWQLPRPFPPRWQRFRTLSSPGPVCSCRRRGCPRRSRGRWWWGRPGRCGRLHCRSPHLCPSDQAGCTRPLPLYGILEVVPAHAPQPGDSSSSSPHATSDRACCPSWPPWHCG